MEINDDNYKMLTQNSYDNYADKMSNKYSENFEKYTKKLADKFMKLLPGKKILELGPGPGFHAQYFQNNGFDVLCYDYSSSMIELCKQKGLKTIKGDIEALELDEKFDGMWAFASLLHIPKKKIKRVISSIHSHLNDKGIFAVSLKRGEGEELIEDSRYEGTRRYFSYYKENEFGDLCNNLFNTLYIHRREGEDVTYITFFLSKK